MEQEKKYTKDEIFKELSKIDLSNQIKQKLGLNYLSWANAWKILKEHFPNAFYTIYKHKITTSEQVVINDNGLTTTVVKNYEDEIPYFTDGKTCWVEVGVTIEGFEEVEIFPIMDNRNNAVRVESVTLTAVNKAIQRAFVKACARHGLGLYIYAGEDLPDDDKTLPNVKEIMNKADTLTLVKLDQVAFDKMKADVIVKVQKNYKGLSNDVVAYVGDLFKGKRLSTLTIEDADNLQKLNFFLDEISKGM